MTDPAALIRHAVTRLALEVEGMSEVPDSHSSIVRILALAGGGEAVLKLQWSRDKWTRECAALRALAGTGVAPTLLDAFADDAGRQAVLMSRVPGDPIGTADRCTPALARELGRALATMHGVTLPATGTDAEGAGWWPWLSGFLKDSVDRCRAARLPGDWDRLELRFADAVAAMPPETDLRLVMFDSRLGNALRDGDRVTGLIDFESARNGSPGMDFAKFSREFHGHPGLWEALLDGYAGVRRLPARLDAAVAVYRMYEPVVAVGFSLKRGRGAGDPFFDANLAAIHRLAG